MRDYSRISPFFWTGATGKELRELGQQTQLIALYLLTCPASNMIGLYHLSIPTLCHDTGSPSQGASKALLSLSQHGFSHFNSTEETIFLPEMARFQIGEHLSADDNRCKGIWNELLKYRKSVFFNDFYEKYQERFHLPERPEAPPFEGACKPLARGFSQEQAQAQDQAQAKAQEQEAFPENLRSREFGEAWEEFRKHRSEIKKPLKPTGEKALLKKISAWGHDLAIRCTREAISNGWTGIFKDKSSAANRQEAPSMWPGHEESEIPILNPKEQPQ